MRPLALTRAAAAALVVASVAACSDAGAPAAVRVTPSAPAAVPAPTPQPVPPAAPVPPAGLPAATSSGPAGTAPPPAGGAPTPPAPANPEFPKPEYPTAEVLGLPTTLNPEGALEFAVYFVQVLDYMGNTQDVELLREASLDSCEYCQILVEADLEGARKGYQLDGSRVWFKAANVDEFDEAARTARLTLESTITAGRLLDRDGHVVRDVAHKELSETLELSWNDGAWRVSWFE
ncbi:hypothetical protein NUM3379_15280 [Kineococcus sp. NUM-3379]